MVIIDIVTN